MESGGAVRAYHTLKELAKHFEVYYIYFVPFQQPLNKSFKAQIDQYAHKSFECQMSHEKTHSYFVDQCIPFWFSDWYLPEVSLLIKRVIDNYDIATVHVDFSQIFYLLRYIPKQVTTVAGAIDIATISFWRRLLESRNIFYFIDGFIKFVQIYFFEKKMIALPDFITVMSPEDEAFLHKLFPSTIGKTQVVRNGLEILPPTKLLKHAPGRANNPITLGFIGSFNHPPNRSAVRYLFEKIIPRLKLWKIPYTLVIAGNTHKDEYNQLLFRTGLIRDKSIHFLGFVKDVDTFYKQIQVLVAPIYSGSGTRIKILESLGRGIPVISTHIGAEGIHIDSPYLTLTDTADGMTQRIEELRDPAALKESDLIHLQEQLREYTWEYILDRFARFLKQQDSQRR